MITDRIGRHEVAIPINNVVANPLIGPVPNTKNIKAVRPVVMFASKIDDKALLNPSLIASFCPLPFFFTLQLFCSVYCVSFPIN